MSSTRRIFTVGHGTRTTEALVDALASAEIRRLIDVRRHPGSRRHPHFSRERLAISLAQSGVDYDWWGEELGGRRRGVPHSRHPAWRNASFRAYADHTDTAVFRTAIAELESAAQERATAVMCSETLWWNCHRRLIADAVTLRGTEVVHIVGAGALQVHELHPSVRRDEEGWPLYDLGETAPLI